MGELAVADNTVTGQGIVLTQRPEQLAEPADMCVQGALCVNLSLDSTCLG